MTFQISSINFWAILASIFINMFIGAVWYSPLLFGDIWLNLIERKQTDISKINANKSMLLSLIPAILSVIMLSLILEFTHAKSVVDALIIGSIASIGFIGMSAWNLVLFEGKSAKLMLLNLGYSFVSLNIAAVIITVWK